MQVQVRAIGKFTLLSFFFPLPPSPALQSILTVLRFSFPGHTSISEECKHLLSRIFVLCDKRITIEEIRKHPWFLQNLPMELQIDMSVSGSSASAGQVNQSEINDLGQSIEEVKLCIKEAMQGPKYDFIMDDDDIEMMNDEYGSGEYMVGE